MGLTDATASILNAKLASSRLPRLASELSRQLTFTKAFGRVAVSETVEVRKGAAPARFIELDILRGFLLLWMTLTHLPTKASLVSNQTFGFVSGAEGFIFLSGFMMGQLEQRIERRSGNGATLRDILKRTVRVYAYHAALLAIAFTLVAEIGVRYHRLALQNLLSYYLADAKHAIIAAGLLEYRPSLLDILPMYVIFLALTPLARSVARRWGWDLVVYASFSVWAVAQFGLRAWLYRHVNLFGLNVPENSTGAFDMYAWQLLWMIGLALGSIYSDQIAGAAGESPGTGKPGIPRWVTTTSIYVAIIFLILRYSPIDRWMDPASYGWLIDKWHLGPGRVIDFAALTIFIVRFGQHIAALRIFQPLALLGQASLEVFSIHVLCCLAGDALSVDADPNLPWWQQVPLVIVTLCALFLTGYLRRLRVAHRKRIEHFP